MALDAMPPLIVHVAEPPTTEHPQRNNPRTTPLHCLRMPHRKLLAVVLGLCSLLGWGAGLL